MPTDDAPDELARALRLAVGRVARRLRRVYVDVEEGVSFLELAVLERLARTGTSSPGELAGDEGVTSAAVAAALTRLESRGLLTRTPALEDRRRVTVEISAAGRHQLRHRDTASVAQVEVALRGLSAAERTRLAAAIPLLEKVADAL